MKDNQPVVAIVGAGFGGLNAAKNLRHAPLQVEMVDQHNYHLFQPLLYQVATAALAPTEIAYPVRSIFRRQKNFNFRLARVNRVDMDKCRLETNTGPVDYDYLILSIGGQNNFFGLSSVQEHAFGLKDLEDGIAIRNHLLKMFELSTQYEDQAICNALRTVVVVGGGPTGVECSGAISELVHLILNKDYPKMELDDTRVLLLEMSDHLLTGFPDDLARNAANTLLKKNVEVRFQASVVSYDGRQVSLKDGEVIPAYTMIWAAGVRADELVDSLGARQARQGRVVVETTMQLPGHPEVFVIGDAAYLEEDGKPLPMMAPVAIQQGKLAARNIQHLQAGTLLENFTYKDPGSLATIGRNAAVARVKNFKFTGFPAWVVWLAVHLFWLIGFRNRLLVLINWASDYIFFERAVRLITPDVEPPVVESKFSMDGQARQDVGQDTLQKTSLP